MFSGNTLVQATPDDLLRRAGFWRRSVALVVDWFLVAIPLLVMAWLGLMFLEARPDLLPSSESTKVDLSQVTMAILFLYVIGLEWLTGSTIGKDITRIKVIDRRNPDSVGLPLRRVFIRALCFFVFSGIGIQSGYPYVGEVDHGGIPVGSAQADIMSYAGGAVALTFVIWILISIVTRSDPIYDRLAGTAVVIR